MKSEHRHELKTNELERIASEWTRASERYAHQHAYQLVAVIVLVIAGIVGFLVWRSGAGSADQQAWQAMLNANNAADFANVAEKYRTTRVAGWARLREAEVELYAAVRLMFTDRAAGRSELKKSQENFEQLIADKSTPDEVMERALFGLARAREVLPPDKKVARSKINDPAIETYQRLLTQFANSVYKEAAESRIKALRTGSAEDFYAWFEAQNPKPADRELPKDLAVPPSPEPAGVKTDTSGDKDTKTQKTHPAADHRATETGAKSAAEKSGPDAATTKSGTGPEKGHPAGSGGPSVPPPAPAK